MGELAATVGKFVSPVEKVIDSITGAIGKAYEPRHVRKMAEAEADRINTIAKVMRENQDIPIVVNSEGVSLSTTDYDEFIKRTKTRMAFQELKKQENIEAVTRKAVNLLDGEEAVTAEPIDRDWTWRFCNSVEDVSNEQMQEIWAKVLAGEAKKPSSYSLRTLNVLHNMTQIEANMFQSICTHCIRSRTARFILQDSEYQSKYNIPFRMILKLEECGLIAYGSFLSVDMTLQPGKELVVMTDDYVMATEITDNSVKISFPTYALTESGMELSNLIGCHMTLAEFKTIAQTIKRRANLKTVKVHRIDSINGDNVNYNSENLLEE